VIVIGLSGLAGSGKDTVADHLVHHYGFLKLAFAQPLKDALTALFGITAQAMDDRQQKEAVIDWIGKSPRQLLQTLGTEWGRHQVADDIWTRIMQHRIKQIERNAPYSGIKGIVISDVRFENEAAWVRQRGWLVHIVRPATIENGMVASSHASERGIKIKRHEDVILNDQGLVELRQQVDAVIGYHL